MIGNLRYRWALRRLTREWVVYGKALQDGLGNPATGPVEAMAFLSLQAKIASGIARVSEWALAPDPFEATKQFGQMNAMLVRFPSLRVYAPLSEKERDEVTQQWHQLFLFLNGLAGAGFAAKRARVADARGEESWGGKPVRRHRRGGIPGIGLLLFVARLGVVVAVLYVIARTIGFFKAAGGRLAFQPPVSLGGAGSNFVASAHEVGVAVGSVFQPVTAAYGIEASLILVGVLILGLAYLIFVRG